MSHVRKRSRWFGPHHHQNSTPTAPQPLATKPSESMGDIYLKFGAAIGSYDALATTIKDAMTSDEYAMFLDRFHAQRLYYLTSDRKRSPKRGLIHACSVECEWWRFSDHYRDKNSGCIGGGDLTTMNGSDRDSVMVCRVSGNAHYCSRDTCDRLVTECGVDVCSLTGRSHGYLMEPASWRDAYKMDPTKYRYDSFALRENDDGGGGMDEYEKEEEEEDEKESETVTTTTNSTGDSKDPIISDSPQPSPPPQQSDTETRKRGRRGRRRKAHQTLRLDYFLNETERDHYIGIARDRIRSNLLHGTGKKREIDIDSKELFKASTACLKTWILIQKCTRQNGLTTKSRYTYERHCEAMLILMQKGGVPRGRMMVVPRIPCIMMSGRLLIKDANDNTYTAVVRTLLEHLDRIPDDDLQSLAH